MTTNFTLTLSNHHQNQHALCLLCSAFVCRLQIQFCFPFYTTLHANVFHIRLNVCVQRDVSTRRFTHKQQTCLSFVQCNGAPLFFHFSACCCVCVSFFCMCLSCLFLVATTTHFHHDYCTLSTCHLVCGWCLFLACCFCIVFFSSLT